MSRAFRGTKSEATAALQRFVTECGAGLQAGSVVTVAVLLDRFLTTAALAPTTRQDWQSVVNRHLVPELGHTALHRLTARDCDHLYHRMALAGLGPSRVRNAHVVLHRAVAQEVRWGWLVRNPVSDATRPEVPRVAVDPSDVDAVRRLLAFTHETDPWIPNSVAGSTSLPQPEHDAAKSARCDGPTSTSTGRPFGSNVRSQQPKSTASSSRPPKPKGSGSSRSPTKPPDH